MIVSLRLSVIVVVVVVFVVVVVVLVFVLGFSDSFVLGLLIQHTYY